MSLRGKVERLRRASAGEACRVCRKGPGDVPARAVGAWIPVDATAAERRAWAVVFGPLIDRLRGPYDPAFCGRCGRPTGHLSVLDCATREETEAIKRLVIDYCARRGLEDPYAAIAAEEAARARRPHRLEPKV